MKNIVLPAVIFMALPALASASGTQLIANGNFETGNLSGWTVAVQGNPSDTTHQDGFYNSGNGGATPLSLNPTDDNPTGGNYYAVSDTNYPDAVALLQTVVIPKNYTSLDLSYDMFVNDWSGIGPVGQNYGLDYTAGGTFNDMQYARVDLLSGTASALSTSATDVVQNFYNGVDNAGGVPPNPWVQYSFNLNGLAAGTYQLRFAEVSNNLAINMGVDNVSLVAGVPPAVPETSSALCMLGMVGGCSLVARRRKSARVRTA